MSFSDDDKKFLKKIIHNELKASEKRTGANLVSTTKQQSDAITTSNKKFLTAAIDKNNKGTATLAQKVEIMKNAVQEQTKQNVTNAKNSAKMGAGQVGKGVSQIGKTTASILMKSNPLAALYGGSIVSLKDLKNLGSGALNIAKGVGTGTVGAVSKLFNAKGIFNKAKSLLGANIDSDKTQDGERKSASGKLNDVSVGRLNVQELVTEKERSNDLISTVKKSPVSVLKDGFTALKGKLQEGVEHSKALVAAGLKKLGLIALGAMGLFALWQWFKSGAFGQMISNALGGVVDGVKNLLNAAENINLNEKGLANQEQKEVHLYRDVSSGLLKTDLELNADRKTYQLSTSNKTSTFNKGNLGLVADNNTNKSYLKKLVKDKVISQNLANLIPKMNNHGVNVDDISTIRQYSNSESGTYITFPVAIKILKVQIHEQGIDILIENADVKKMWKPRLIITNLVKLYVALDTVIPKNTTIGILGRNGEIVGNLEDFMRGESFDSYTDKHTKDSSASNQNLIKLRENDAYRKKMQTSYKKLETDLRNSRAREEFKNNPLKSAHEAYDHIMSKRTADMDTDYHPQNPSNFTPPTTQPGPNQQKAEQQSNQLNKTQSNKNNNNTNSGKQKDDTNGQRKAYLGKSTPGQHIFGNFMDVQQYNNSNPDSINMGAVLGC